MIVHIELANQFHTKTGQWIRIHCCKARLIVCVCVILLPWQRVPFMFNQLLASLPGWPSTPPVLDRLQHAYAVLYCTIDNRTSSIIYD